jgi:hypothetical protein
MRHILQHATTAANGKRRVSSLPQKGCGFHQADTQQVYTMEGAITADWLK